MFLPACGERLLTCTTHLCSSLCGPSEQHYSCTDVWAAVVGRPAQCCPRLSCAFIVGEMEVMDGCSLARALSSPWNPFLTSLFPIIDAVMLLLNTTFLNKQYSGNPFMSRTDSLIFRSRGLIFVQCLFNPQAEPVYPEGHSSWKVE